jgi:hypothetical protein
VCPLKRSSLKTPKFGKVASTSLKLKEDINKKYSLRMSNIVSKTILLSIPMLYIGQ